jgi:single-strand DNA-binding protein
MNGVTACLTGRVGGDPDFRYSANGNPFLAFSLAVDDTKRAEGEPTEWVRVACFGELAEALNGKLMKGGRCYAEGRLRLETWTSKGGDARATLKLAAWVVQPMGVESRRPTSHRPPDGRRPRQDDDQPRRMPEAMAVGAGRNMRQALDLDDELPF